MSSVTVHGLFRQVCRERPHAVALCDDISSMDYATLDRVSDQLCAHLKRAGVSGRDFVGVYLERSADFVVAILAILKSGGAYVPLPLDYPAERLAMMAEDCRVRCVVTHRRHVATLPGDGQRMVVMDDAGEWPCDEPVCMPTLDADATAPAYVMFTSGSTGRPKGVVVPHRAIVRLVQDQTYARFGPELRTLLLAPTAFDASTFEIWAPLLNGGSGVVFPDAVPDPTRLREVLRQGQVNCLWLTAGLFNMLIDVAPETLETVEHVLTGGEALSVPHVLRALQRFPGLRLTNGYGPTEGTTFSCTYDVPRGVTFGAGGVPIGTPLAGTQCTVVDEDLQPLPDGQVGELLIGGLGVALGYVVPETAPGTPRFVGHTRPPLTDTLSYRSGDLCRRRPDGLLEFIGRKDRQLKIRGHRIEPSEIEAALCSLPGIAQAAVEGQRIADAGTTLVAYVVACTDAATPDPAAVREALKARLPAACIPGIVVTLAALPLTAQGKVDRTALPWPVPKAVPHAGLVDRPLTPRESALAEVWTSVLGARPIRADDDFFDMGGHSLAAMRLVAQAESQLGLAADLPSVFAVRTLAGLADHWRPTTAAHEEALALDTAQDWPASPGQQQIYALHCYAPQSSAYNIAEVHRLQGPLDVEALQFALDGLVQAHGSLRSTFLMTDAGLRQHVAARGCWPLEVRHADEAGAARILQQCHCSAFDLEKGPLVDACLIIVGAQQHVLLLRIHHIVADGWSMDLLHDALARGYAAARADVPRITEPQACAMARAIQHDTRRDAAEHARLLAWWHRYLATAPAELPLPTDRPRQAVNSFRGATLVHRLAPTLHAQLIKRAHDAHCTPYVIVLAAFAQALRQWTGTSDLILGVPIADRPSAGLQAFVGYRVQVLPLRLIGAGVPLDAQTLAYTQEQLLDVIAHAGIPVDRLLEASGRRAPANGRHPLFNVLCSWQDDRTHALTLEGLEVTRESFDGGDARFDLSLFAVDTTAGLELRLEYSTALFDAATVADLLEAVLGGLAERSRPRKSPSRTPATPSRPLPQGGVSADSPNSPPRSLLELRILEIWERLFGCVGLSRHDNFFDLGGDSLLAARMILALEPLIGQRLATARLFQTPTVASLAQSLEDEHWVPAWTALVPLKPGGSRPPLFVVHGWGGEVFAFVPLAQAMPADQPVYGLQAVGLDGRSPRHEDLRSMVRHYAREIRSFCPSGPCRIAGYSLGGWIALEVARELIDSGIDASVVVLDTHPNCTVPASASPWAKALFLRDNPGMLRQRLMKRLRLPMRVAAAHGDGLATAGSGTPDYYKVMVARHEATVFTGNLHVVLARQRWRWLLLAFWHRMTSGRVTYSTLGCGHHEMLDEPHVTAVAAAIGS